MKLDTQVLSTLSASFGVGDGPEIPELIMPVISIPLALGPIASAAGVDLRGRINSAQVHRTLNQGASTAAITASMCVLDRGIYRIAGSVGAMAFGGITASSASAALARFGLFTPNDSAFAVVADVPINTTGAQISFDFVVNLSLSDWDLSLRTLIATGVGESIAAWASVNVSRIL